MINKYLISTKLLDYDNQEIQELIKKKGWNKLNEDNKIRKIYGFVRDDILFGYNKKDNLSASQILKDGYGQCNTKAILLMALLRGVSIQCRFHGFTINKELQRGVISGIWYKLAPTNIIHSWIEVKYKNKWKNLEGVILDIRYLKNLQAKFKDCKGTFCGYGVYTDNFQNPKVDWKGDDTYIQNLGINKDFGIFDNPDKFYETHRQNLSIIKRLIFNLIARKVMNMNVKKIRHE